MNELLELAELRKKNAELVQFISENTPILSYLAIECTTNLNEFKSWLAIRDLEQQANGIEDFTSCCKESLDWDWSMISAYELFDMMRIRAKELREQAKQLKGDPK